MQQDDLATVADYLRTFEIIHYADVLVVCCNNLPQWFGPVAIEKSTSSWSHIHIQQNFMIVDIATSMILIDRTPSNVYLPFEVIEKYLIFITSYNTPQEIFLFLLSKQQKTDVV